MLFLPNSVPKTVDRDLSFWLALLIKELQSLNDRLTKLEQSSNPSK